MGAGSRIRVRSSEGRGADIASGGPGYHHTPRWSAAGDRLGFVCAGADSDAIWVVDIADSTASTVTIGSATIADGWRVEELEWVDDTRLAMLVAPRGSDDAVGAGSVRARRSGIAPIVFGPGHGRRTLMTITLPAGTTTILETGPVTVWEFSPLLGRGFVAVVSDDASESGWYRARLSLLDGVGNEHVLHQSEWQVARPRVSPDGTRVAIVEGWSSDRGHVAGDGVVVDLTGTATSVVSLDGIDLTTLEWVDDRQLQFWGWRSTTSVHGVVGRDGVPTSIVVDGEVLREVTVSPGGGSEGCGAVMERAGAPERLVTRSRDGPWTAVDLGEAGGGLDVQVDDLTWSADDGTEIHGLLVVRRDVDRRRCPPVLAIHGGPANLWTRAASRGVAALAWSGYAVILPNPRGSVGRGQAFARANLGDPGGRELDDILAAAAMCRRNGLVADQAPAVVGGSYGGYLTAAAAVHHDVAAAVVMFGHPDLISARFGSNNPAFYDVLLGGPPSDMTNALYLERSPVLWVNKGTAPTLILHGEADRCTPLGQAEELFRALCDHDVATELVVYPDEGHGLRSPTAQLDAWQRTIDWFDRHVGRQAVR